MSFKVTWSIVLVGFVSLGLIGCAGQKQLTTVNQSPEKLGRIGAQITESPDSKPQILSRHGLSPDEFTRAIREIASDVELSSRYHDAFREALRTDGESSA